MNWTWFQDSDLLLVSRMYNRVLSSDEIQILAIKEARQVELRHACVAANHSNWTMSVIALSANTTNIMLVRKKVLR